MTRDESPSQVRAALGLAGPLPEAGTDPALLLDETAQLLFEHSLFNGHPRFFGYITAPPAPIGMLGDLLAAAVNPNVGAWTLSPAATEIEVADGALDRASSSAIPADCGGLLVSGGNMANFVGFLAAARPRRPAWTCARHGVGGGGPPAARLRLGRDAHLDSEGGRPRRVSAPTRSAGSRPTRAAHGRRRAAPPASTRTAPPATCRSIVVGTAGSVSTGAVDPLPRDRRALPRARRLVPRRRRLRRVRGRAFPRRPPTCAALSARRFGRGRSAQVAVRAARGRLRAGARPGSAARGVRLPPAVLPLRGTGDQLRRLRPAELARLPRAQGLARAATRRRGGLSAR